jgi:hypothetical protein
MFKNQKKVRKTKAKPVDRAKPVIRKPKTSDGEKITVTRSMTTAMKGSSLWASSPNLQASVGAWNKAADAVEANAKLIADARSNLAALEATQRVARHAWVVTTRQVTADADTASQGSADMVHSLGFDVVIHVPAGTLEAPTGLVTLPGTALGEAVIAWQRGKARHGFIVQRAADVANPASYVAPVPCTKTKCAIAGLAPAAVVHFRVAAIDPTSDTGASPWSEWVACTVR